MPDDMPGRGCKWPMWPHSSRPTHEYCGRERVPGQTYCKRHYAMSVRSGETEKRKPFVPRRSAA